MTVAEARVMIAVKLKAEGARDLSDSEIRRCLGGTCMPTKLTRLAMVFRDSEYMTMEHVQEPI